METDRDPFDPIGPSPLQVAARVVVLSELVVALASTPALRASAIARLRLLAGVTESGHAFDTELSRFPAMLLARLT